MLKNDFKVDLWEYLHDIDRCGSELNSLIYQFMELNGIKEDGTSSDTIKKIYQRKKNSYKTALNRKMKKKDSDLNHFFVGIVIMFDLFEDHE